MSTIAAKLTPNKLKPQEKQIVCNTIGIQCIECTSYKLLCFESYTGVKFILTCDLSVESIKAEAKLKDIYRIYSDYVCKNPFHHQDLQIKYTLFENAINNLFAK